MVDDDAFRPVGRSASRKGAAGCEVNAQSGEKVGINGIHIHAHALPVRSFDVVGADAEGKLAIDQGHTGHTRLGKGGLLEAFAKASRVRPTELDDYDLVNRVA